MRYTTFLVTILTVIWIACGGGSQDDYKQSKSGLKYKIHTSKEGKKAQDKQVLIVHRVTKTDADSVIASTYKRGKTKKMPVSKENRMYDIFSQLSSGDSVTILESTDSIIAGSSLEDWPSFIKNSEHLKYELKVIDIKSKEEVSQLSMTPGKQSPQTQKEVKEIKAYMKKNELEAKSTPSGLHYIIDKAGTGPKPTSESVVIIHYEGKVLDGKLYDSTYKRGKPIEFKVKNLFPGLKEGVMLLQEGAEARLFIPSPLAFGEKGRGENVPPNATMLFDIKLLKVKKGGAAS